MKRRVVWTHLPLAVLLVMILLMDYMVVDGRPASELWRPELMDELTLDEWPVGEEDAISNDDDGDPDPMDMDERIYEMEALMAERHEQTAVDGITNGMNDDDDEEEDDVDQDDYEEEEEEENDGDNGQVANQENAGLLEERLGSQQSFDSRTNDDRHDEASMLQKDNIDSIFIPAAAAPLSSSPKATSRLQQQEEQDLEVLDQSIVDTLRMALDTVKQDRPQRFIPLDENTPATKNALVETQTSSFSISLFLTSGFHVSASWTSYWILGILLSLITLSYRKFRQKPIRDCHHLPSYSVYKQKSSVD